MAKDDITAKDVMNFYVDPNCLEVAKELEVFTGQTPMDFIDSAIRSYIKLLLGEMRCPFPEYVDNTAKGLDIDFND